MAPKDFIFVVYDKKEDGAITLIEAHSSNDNAKAAAKALKSSGSSNVEVKKLELKSEVDAAAATGKGKAKVAARPKADTSKKAKSAEMVNEEDDETADEDAENAPKAKKGTSKKAEDAKAAKKTIPEGRPDVLKDLKLLFTGTMSMDRKTSEATAKKYGATIVKKLEETDYIILGTRPGQQKVDAIEEHSLETITEDEFLDMLNDGVPKEKRDRMAAKAEAAKAAEGEPAKKKQKK